MIMTEAQECILSQTVCARRHLDRRVLGIKPSARGSYVPLRAHSSGSVSDEDTSLRLVTYINESHEHALTDPNPDLTGFQDTNSHHSDGCSCDYRYTHAAWHL